MQRTEAGFSFKAALLCLASLFLIEILAIGAFGAKACGDLVFGFYYVLYLVPYFFMQHPLSIAPLVAGFFFGGMVFPRISYNRKSLLFSWLISALIVTVVVVSYTHRSPAGCTGL